MLKYPSLRPLIRGTFKKLPPLSFKLTIISLPISHAKSTDFFLADFLAEGLELKHTMCRGLVLDSGNGIYLVVGARDQHRQHL